MIAAHREEAFFSSRPDHFRVSRTLSPAKQVSCRCDADGVVGGSGKRGLGVTHGAKHVRSCVRPAPCYTVSHGVWLLRHNTSGAQPRKTRWARTLVSENIGSLFITSAQIFSRKGWFATNKQHE